MITCRKSNSNKLKLITYTLVRFHVVSYFTYSLVERYGKVKSQHRLLFELIISLLPKVSRRNSREMPLLIEKRFVLKDLNEGWAFNAFSRLYLDIHIPPFDMSLIIEIPLCIKLMDFK